jgi:dolichol-phosphate mannosyltransferase
MLSIVIPTYCEAENISRLVQRIDEVMNNAGISYEMLVVDDNSPDDIVDIARTLSSDFPIRLLQPEGRQKDLSLSVIDGLKAAQSDLVLVMDADHSHPPEKIPEMYKVLTEEEGVFVVGSRYVSEGRFGREWSIWRFLNSYIATLLTRPLVSCEDPMSGFFALNRQRIGEFEDLNPIGYKIGLELMVRGQFNRIAEVPISFKDRALGESKMNLRQQLHYLRHLRRLYTSKFGSFAELVNYGFVGASGFFVDIFCYYLFQLLGLPHQAARALSFWPAVSWNWILSRIATFGARKRRPGARQWIEFVMTSLVGFALNWGIYVTLTSRSEFFDQYRLLALIAGTGAASIFNFVLSSLYVYSEKRL